MAFTTLSAVQADLHNYLMHRSNTSKLDFDQVVQLAQSRLGPKGVVGVTNFHDTRYETLVNHARSKLHRTDLGNAVWVLDQGYNILFVKAQRVPTKDGRLSVIGLEKNKHIREGRTLEDTLKEAREEHDAILVAPHPFYKGGLGERLEAQPELLQQFDALEVYSGQAELWIPWLLPGWANNDDAEIFFEDVIGKYAHLGALTSSGGASLGELGRSSTSLLMPGNYASLQGPDDVQKALRYAVRRATPEDGTQESAKLMALLHQLVVFWDHNPLSRRLFGVPNDHLDHLFQ